MNESDKAKPSNITHGTLWIVRVYPVDSIDPQVYTRAKHVWWKAEGKLLVILHYFDDGTHRYVVIPTERIAWLQMAIEGTD